MLQEMEMIGTGRRSLVSDQRRCDDQGNAPIVPAMHSTYAFSAVAQSLTTLGLLVAGVYAGDGPAFIRDLGINRTAYYHWLRTDYNPGKPAVTQVTTLLRLTRAELRVLYDPTRRSRKNRHGIGVPVQYLNKPENAALFDNIKKKLRALRNAKHPEQVSYLQVLLKEDPQEVLPDLSLVQEQAKAAKPKTKPVEIKPEANTDSNNNYLFSWEDELQQREQGTAQLLNRLEGLVTRVECAAGQIAKHETRIVWLEEFKQLLIKLCMELCVNDAFIDGSKGKGNRNV